MMDMNELSNLLLHYGRATSDLEFREYEGTMVELFTRVRTFIYNGRHFYHVMCNGKVVECFELK